MKKIIRKVKLRTWIGGFLILILLPIAVLAVYNAEASPNPPTGYWGFNEGTDNTCPDGTSDACDRSGNSNDLTRTNALWQESGYCVSHKCVYLDGTGDYFTRADDADFDFAAADSFSIAGWFRHPIISTSSDFLIAKHGTAGSNGGYKIYMDSDGDIVCGIDDDDTFEPDASAGTTNANYDDNQWHYFECVKNGTTSLQLYMDGKLVNENTSISGVGTLVNSDALYIGIDGDGSTGSWAGFLDEVKIYRYGRTNSQVLTDSIKSASIRGSSAVMGATDTAFLTDGLVGYWNMNETSWTNNCSTDSVLDSSGNNLHGDACPNSTGPTGGATGKFGNGGDFDGTDDKIMVPDDAVLDLTSSVSAGAWINPDASNSYHRIIAKIDTGETGGYMLDIAVFGAIRFRINQTDCISSQGAVTDGNWSHVMGTYDSKNIRIYVNGQLIKECTDTEAISANNESLAIGDRPDGNSRFNGRIDEVRVYKRALNSIEAANLYNWAPGPTHYWKMDENVSGDAKNLYDSSGNGKTATTSTADAVGVNCTHPSKFGTGCDLDGSDDIVRVDSPAAPTKDFTYSMWFSKDGVSTTDTLLTIPDSGGGNEIRLLVSSTVGYNVDGGSTVTGSVTFTSGSWNHVALVRTGSSIKSYVNGQLNSSSTDADALDFSTCSIYVGSDIDSAANCTTKSDYFNGKVDDFKIYNYGRTAAQVIEDMNGGHPVGGSPIGSQNIYWKFDEGQGTTANSAVAGTTSGTLTNMSSPPTSTSGWTANGKVDKALVFDGSNDVVTIATASDSFVDFNGSEAFSASAWVYSTTLPASGDQDAIIAKWDSTTATSEGYKLFLDGDSTTAHFGVTISDESAVQTISANASDNTASANTWYNVAFTFNGGTAGTAGDLKIYVNGKLVGSNSANASFLGLEDVTSDFTVGDYDATDAVATNTAFTGMIDEVQVYGSLLTNEQIEIVRNANATSNFGSTTDEDEVDLAAEGNPPVAWYNFDENTGTTVKNSGSGTGANDGTFSNTAKFWPGKYGSGVYFDGNSTGNGTAVELPDNAFDSLSQGSVEFWFKPNDTGDAFQEMFGVANGPNNSLAIEIAYVPASNQVQMWTTGCGSGNIDQTAGTGFVLANPTAWHHFAYVVNSTDSFIYIDGIMTFSSTADCFFDEVSSGTNTNYEIGCIHWSSDTVCYSSEMFEGVIDEVKIYDYARNPAQLAYDFNRGLPLSHWKFDECTGSTAYDAGPNALNLTFYPGLLGVTSVGDCSTASTMRYAGADGKYNSSVDFDGSDDSGALADANNTIGFNSQYSDFSVFAWIKRDNTGEQYIFSHEDSSDNDGWKLQLNSSNQVVCGVDAIDTTSSSSITDTSWHFIGCTIDRDGNGQVYVDGRPNGSAVAISSEVMSTSQGASVGFRNITEANAFNGLIDEIQIYGYALTAAQVRKMYNQNAGARFGPLIGRP